MVFNDEEQYLTIISNNERDKDYVSGKYVTVSQGTEVVSAIPLIYIALIFIIVGGVIIAIQLLHDNIEQRKKYDLLNLLGLSAERIRKVLFRNVFVFFLLPIVPSLILGNAIVFRVLSVAYSSYFSVPVLTDIYSHIFINLGIINLILLSMYSLYVLICYFTLKRTIFVR